MKRITTLFLVVALTGLVACDKGPLPGESVAAAAENAKEAGSAKVFMSMEQQMPQGSLTMEGDGAFDFEGQAGTLSMTMAGIEGMGGAPGMPETRMDMVFEGFVMYMRLPALQQLLPPGKTWVKLDMAKMGKEMGIDMAQLAQMGQNNPAQGLEYLQGATDVKELGSEQVRGVETTHYSGTIDFDKLAEDVQGEAAESIRKAAELSGMNQVPFEVWLDADGLPRRMTFKMTPQGAPGETSMTMELYDYGTHVDIAIPPANEVVDFGQFLKSAPG